MEANPRNLDVLFNSQLRYVVPMFQRLYVWQENPQWDTLWEDIKEKADKQMAGTQTNPHYLGALIIEGVRPSSPREVKRFLVIDGQQRLTTLQLIFCAFRDYARENEWKTLDRATTRYLENADPDVMEHPDEELLKLWPTTLNRNIFRQIVSAGSAESVESQFPITKLRYQRKPEPRSNLIEAYLFFSRAIRSWIKATTEQYNKPTEDCAFALLQALQQDFCVVQIVLSEGDDSQEIFYSLNSQAKPLSQSDLLRSLIFMRAEKEKINRDALFDDYWSKFETDFWSKEVRRGGRTYSRLDLGLRYFLMTQTGKLADARRVSEDYRRWITAQPPRYPSVRDELADFLSHADCFREYESVQSTPLPCTDIRRVIRDFDVSTVIPLLIYLEIDAGLSSQELANCQAVVESFIVRRAFVGEETKEYNKLFAELIGTLRETPAGEVCDALVKKIQAGGGTTRRWPSDNEVIEAALTRPIYGSMPTSALRLILERIEIDHRTKKSEQFDVPHGLQIEHVLPISWCTHWSLKGKTIAANDMKYPYQAEESMQESIRTRTTLLQTFGNLTLLNNYLNPAASNGSFATKLTEYKNSVLRLNRYFDHLNAWDEEAIYTRGKIFGEMVCRLWSRPVSPTI